MMIEKKEFIYFKELNSTNEKANYLIKNNEIQEGTVIYTYKQTAGKGQGKNYWESEERKNLTFTIVLRPFHWEAINQFQLSKLISLGIINFLEKYNNNIFVKWPNDIYIGEKKIAGILIENYLCGNNLNLSLVGVGVNINQTKFKKETPNPISLKQILKRDIELDKSLKEICHSIMSRYNSFNPSTSHSLENEYINKLYKYNVFCKYKTDDNIFEAKIVGISSTGQLILKDRKNKIKKYGFKEIHLVL